MKHRFRFFKKRVPAPTAPESAYYEKISERFGILQILLYVSLFAFVVVSLLFNTHLITYQNFYLFFKDLNASVELPTAGNTDVLTYQTGKEMDFTLYRGGLAVTTENSITLFSATGRQTLSRTVSYRDPVSVGAGKYLLVYEQGGYNYSLFNSYTQIFEGKSEYPINDAAVSDSGIYALVTGSKTHTTEVTLYSERFSVINRYQKNGYVTDVAIEKDGKYVAVLTVGAKDGFAESELMLCIPGEGESAASLSVNAMGWMLSFTDNDRIAVLFDTGLYFYNTRCQEINSYSFDSQRLLHADVGTNGAALCLSRDGIDRENRLLLFDKNGKLLYAHNTYENVYGISRCENALYWTTDTHVWRMNRKNGKTDSTVVSTSDMYLLAVDGREALLCSPQKAEYITF